MSAFESSTFYSDTHPENVGSPANPPPQAKAADAFPDNPPYARYADAESFAPSSTPAGGSFQPELQTVQEASQISLPLIAAGLFALWIIFKGER